MHHQPGCEHPDQSVRKLGCVRDDDGGGIIPILLTAILAPLAAMLIQAAISRSREFEADAGAASMTGNPDGLARLRGGR